MTRAIPAVAAVGLLCVGARAQDATAVVDAAARALGADRLESIQYSGTGNIFLVGQAAIPGGPWPRFTLSRYVANVDYASLEMREQIVRVDDERPPRGGGAGPFNPATGQGGIRPIPGTVTQVRGGRSDTDRLQAWMTPHGFIKAAAQNHARMTMAAVGGRRQRTLTFTVLGKYTITGIVDDRDRLERVSTRVPNAMLGEMTIESVFSDYRDVGGVQFPMRIVQRQGGHPTLELNVADVRPMIGATGVPRPEPAASGSGAAEPRAASRVEPSIPGNVVEARSIAPGIWLISGGSPNSIVIEFADHVVVVEAPQDASYSAAAISLARQVARKPIRYVVSTHHHFDHAGGLRGYVEEAIPILAHESTRAYYESILKDTAVRLPATLVRELRVPHVEPVGARRVLSDATRTMELHHVRGNLHSAGLLMVYLRRERMLIQADAFHPRPGAAPLPAPSPYTVNLLENIRRLKLDVAQIVHVHGGVDAFEALVRAAGS